MVIGGSWLDPFGLNILERSITLFVAGTIASRFFAMIKTERGTWRSFLFTVSRREWKFSATVC